MIHGRGESRVPADREMIYFKDAAWPAPFKAGLEYNSPCHGTWNIVHIGMAVPGAHQIYVCGANCNRGVVLTAAEMKESERYSTLALYEDNLINGDMETLIIEGVTEILYKLPKMPPLVFLFTVCVHRFMGVDLDYIYQELRSRFPDVIFVESYMEPISQKDGLTPEQRLRDGMFSVLNKKEDVPVQVSILGSDMKIEESSEMKEIFREAGMTVLESSACQTMDQYLSMGNSSLFVTCYPTALHGVKKLAARLQVPYLYLPASFSYQEINHQMLALRDQLLAMKDQFPAQKDRHAAQKDQPAALRMPDARKLQDSCEEELKDTLALIGDTPVAIDAHAVPRWLGLARLLISHDFHVIRLYGDAFSTEEKEDYEWLREHAPNLELCSMIHPGMRVFKRGQEEKVLAIGQKAAYFHDTPFFVNIVQGGGLHGYDGICRMARMMREAFLEEKDTRDLVGRKGLGWESY